MILNKSIFVMCISVMTFSASGQITDTIKNNVINPNSIQLELLGPGILYSFSYEYVFINKPKYKTTGQIGIAYFWPEAGVDLITPLQVCQLFSFKKHHLEIGFGYSVIYELWHEEKNSQLSGLFNGRIGYRYQKPDGKFLFRIGFIPFAGHYITDGDEYYKLDPWGGISFGYSFGR